MFAKGEGEGEGLPGNLGLEDADVENGLEDMGLGGSVSWDEVRE